MKSVVRFGERYSEEPKIRRNTPKIGAEKSRKKEKRTEDKRAVEEK